MFTKLNLSLSKLQGYCFDGESKMSSELNGVRASSKEACPNALYVHCSCHALNPVLPEAAKSVLLIIIHALYFVQGVSVAIVEFHKGKNFISFTFWSRSSY